MCVICASHMSHRGLTGFVDRVQRLKDARSEAQKEIDEYRKSKEDEFNAFQSSVRVSAAHPTSQYS